jgi:hypothetical protein
MVLLFITLLLINHLFLNFFNFISKNKVLKLSKMCNLISSFVSILKRIKKTNLIIFKGIIEDHYLLQTMEFSTYFFQNQEVVYLKDLFLFLQT